MAEAARSAPPGLRRLLLVLVVATALFPTGCVPVMSRLFVSAPNHGNLLAGRVNVGLPDHLAGVDQRFWVDVGPPYARLSVAVVNPPGDVQPRGTVLVVHGFRNRAFWMRDTANLLAGSGYRAVLVDLRGHGRSSGDWLSYGVHESADLSQVIDALEERGLVAGRLGVYGISLGASTAIQLAGRDPRVAAVAAVAPFASMRDEVPHYFRTVFLPARWIDDATLQEAIDHAGWLGGFDPDEASALRAIRQTAAPVLIVHGTDDWLVPPQNGILLHTAAPRSSQLVLLPGLGHVTIWQDPRGEVALLMRNWFDRHLPLW
jgi:pimeloyl-ACP methyl ester carboxylesterase